MAVACSNGSQGVDGSAAAGDGAGGAPSQGMDANPHVITTPTRTPNGATAQPGGHGGGGTTGNGRRGAAGTTGSAGATGTASVAVGPRSGTTVDCVGGPCAGPNVCVNLDFLFVACVPCGGNDQVCCPPYDSGDPFLGTCDAGLVCAHNPNYQASPPLDLVLDVCQDPASPPPADGRLNHERLILFP